MDGTFDFYAFISRMKYIGRWSLMRNSEPENIQEHSHMCAVLAHALGLIRREVFGLPCDPEHLAAIALFHDAPEILTGDLPTPVKYHSREIKSAYDEVEELAVEKLVGTLPAQLRPAYRELLTASGDPELYSLVKAADKICAYLKCVEERKAGNLEFLSAENAAKRKIAAMHIPEADWFMEHCVPAFEKNLDELGPMEEA